jgi:diguanylate cyclase (GGDEF)-like protein
VKRLTTLCALGAANERTWGIASDDDATRDPVTGVYNAAFMNAFLTQALSQARRRGESLAILCMGVDWLTNVRDEHGAEIADAALRRMARAIVATLRTSDVVARSYENRLIAVLPAATMTDAFRVAESVRRAVLEAGMTAATATPVSTSIGVAAYPDHATEVGPLLAAAGEALARAYAQGPSSIVAAPRAARPIAPSIVRSVG